jgi:5-methylcytosine-specific restriction protein A
MHKVQSSEAKRHGTNDARANANDRGYGYRWRRFREQYLFQNPLCVHCQASGIHTPANEVDHIKPHRGDSVLFWDIENLQPLCKSCHSKKTRHEQQMGLV